MALAIRMGLYFLFAAIAGQGVGTFDQDTGNLTLHVESLATVLAGVVGYVGTFAAGRWAKARGGLT